LTTSLSERTVTPTHYPLQQQPDSSLTATTTATMPKQSNKKQGSKQQRIKGKPYQRYNPKAALKLPTIQHKQTAASPAKALGCHGINSLLAETAAELQEKGIKQKGSIKAGKAHAMPEQQQQQEAHAAAAPQPDIMSLLGGWSMNQKTEVEQGQQQQQQPQAGQQTAAV
jgi:hypothetical protein